MPRICLALLWTLAFPVVAMADESSLICFGNEPSWSVDLTQPGIAKLMDPDQEPVSYSGTATRNEVLQEKVWRGAPDAGGDLVVFLREAACSDGMSNTLHPVTARVSTADGRLLAGCCRIPAAVESVMNKSLEGISWRLSSLGAESPSGITTTSRPVIARFEAGQISGFSGCNNFVGSYSVDGDNLKIGPLAGSMMACAEEVTAIESAFHAALSAADGFSISANQLTLVSGSGAVLAFTADAPPQLGGVTWEVTGYNNNRQAVVSPPGDRRVTLSFEAGTVSGNAICNAFRAPYTTDGNRIEIGLPATTKMACPGPLMEEEQAFLAALQSAVTWSLDGNILDMHRADEQRAIMAIIKR